ncbi:hypothetical protein [Nocardioides zeicaulis]|uniref:Uncharacterized protein n=1 Tax=Nocardioides zeicaulis TaxID=1776857 RepID=A0ABV6E366_9ACTN
MSTRLRFPSVVLGVALIVLALAGCGQDDVPGDPAPSSGTTSASTSPAPTATAVAANVVQLCDHAQDAFRSGSLTAVDQNRSLASELHGMMDVAEPSAAEVLRPMAEAADAIALDGRDRPRPELQQAMDQAFDALRQACTSAGSSAWE